eukprot:m.168908 g.168908  ORF g.168908 m.168908 type:complete len:263 (+) comp18222_c0_seq7:221-1009(+)
MLISKETHFLHNLRPKPTMEFRVAVCFALTLYTVESSPTALPEEVFIDHDKNSGPSQSTFRLVLGALSATTVLLVAMCLWTAKECCQRRQTLDVTMGKPPVTMSGAGMYRHDEDCSRIVHTEGQTSRMSMIKPTYYYCRHCISRNGDTSKDECESMDVIPPRVPPTPPPRLHSLPTRKAKDQSGGALLDVSHPIVEEDFNYCDEVQMEWDGVHTAPQFCSGGSREPSSEDDSVAYQSVLARPPSFMLKPMHKDDLVETGTDV